MFGLRLRTVLIGAFFGFASFIVAQMLYVYTDGAWAKWSFKVDEVEAVKKAAHSDKSPETDWPSNLREDRIVIPSSKDPLWYYIAGGCGDELVFFCEDRPTESHWFLITTKDGNAELLYPDYENPWKNKPLNGTVWVEGVGTRVIWNRIAYGTEHGWALLYNIKTKKYEYWTVKSHFWDFKSDRDRAGRARTVNRIRSDRGQDAK